MTFCLFGSDHVTNPPRRSKRAGVNALALYIVVVIIAIVAVCLWSVIGWWDGIINPQPTEFDIVRDKIIQYVRAHPDQGEFTLNRLLEDGAIDATDRETIEAFGARYFPFSADSPSDQVLFVLPHANGEIRYFKSHPPLVFRRMTSHDELLAFVDTPPVPSTSGPHVRMLRNEQTQRVLLQWDSAGYLRGEPEWRSDSRAIAFLEDNSHGGRCDLTVLVVDGREVVKVVLPTALDPRDVVPPAYRTTYELEWEPKAIIDRFRWKGDLLQFHWVTFATILNNGMPDGTIEFNYELQVEFDNQGNISIVGRREYGILGRRDGKLFHARL
jgi:hypothetical protein